MTGCCAINCTNSTEKKYRTFRFPADPIRRKKWVINCRRDNWVPTEGTRICEVHFEATQFERNRADGKKLLSPNAIPTLFNIKNPPPMIDKPTEGLRPRNNCNRIPNDSVVSSLSENVLVSSSSQDVQIEIGTVETIPNTSGTEGQEPSYSQSFYEEKIKKLKIENEKSTALLKRMISSMQETNEALVINNKLLETKVNDYENLLHKFLTSGQISSLWKEKQKKWDDESIVKGLKFRFAMGVDGYKYLHESKYPIPSYSTLCRRIQQFQVQPGIFHDLLEPLKYKAECMDKMDRCCVMSVDEMAIQPSEDFCKQRNEFCGFVTLGTEKQKAELGTHILVVLIRGIKKNWKQIVACHVTGNSLKPEHLKPFLYECIEHVENKCGLRVIGLTSDMGPSNQALWSSWTVGAKRDGFRNNTFFVNDHEIAVIPDVCHLLKNLKGSLLKNNAKLPNFLSKKIGLSQLKNEIISGEYLKYLWLEQAKSPDILRSLVHLKEEDINPPDSFHKMNVGSAKRYLSEKSAAAIDLAIHSKILSNDAASTSWFFNLISEWFEMVTSRIRAKSITKRNFTQKIGFLKSFLNIVQNIRFDSENDIWKPLNNGLILATLSLIDLSTALINAGFDFVLLSRFTQDALENVFSQVRRKAASTPTAQQCFTALKLISVSQFISDVRQSNYMSESDQFLINHFTVPTKELGVAKKIQSNLTSDTSLAPPESNKKTFKLFKLADVPNIPFSNKTSLNMLFYQAGCAERYLEKKNLCNSCRAVLNNLTRVPKDIYSQYLVYIRKRNWGNEEKGIGLKIPSIFILEVMINCHVLYHENMNFILRNNCTFLLDEWFKLIELHLPSNCCNPRPCNLKKIIIRYFFKIYSYSIVTLNANKATKVTMFGTAGPKKKKIQKVAGKRKNNGDMICKTENIVKKVKLS